MNNQPFSCRASRLVSSLVIAAATSCHVAAQCQPQWRIGASQGFPGANAEVQGLGLGDPDGAGPLSECLIATGTFTFIGDARTYGVAYWNPAAASGSGWVGMARTDQSSGTNISTVGRFGNRIVIGGLFGSINPFWLPGTQPTNVAAWDGSKWLPMSATQDLPFISSFAELGSTLYASARDASTPSTRALYRYTPGATTETGTWTPVTANVDGTVNKILVFNNELYLFGSMRRSITPGTRFQVAKLNGVGTDLIELPSLGNTNGTVYGGVVFQGSLYIYGAFTVSNGAPTGCERVAKLNASGTAWIPATTDASNSVLATLVNSVRSAAVFNDALFVGTELGTKPLLSLSATNGVWTTYPSVTAPSNSIQAMIPSPDCTRLALGGTGSFNYTGTSTSRFAFWTPATNTYEPPAKGLGNDVFGYPFVNGSAAIGSDLYLGGDISVVGETSGRFLAKWNGTSLTAAPGAPVSAIDKMFTDPAGGGLFLNVSSYLRRYDGASTSAPIGDNTGGSYASGVFGTAALTRYQGTLVIGGSFSGSGGKPSYLMRRTGTIESGSWARFGAADPNGAVSALAAWSHPSIASGAPLLVATGSFSSIGALTTNVAAWDGTTWRALGQASFGPGYSASAAVALPILNGDLYMAVYANGINGNFNNYPVLIRYNPATDLWVEIPRPATGPNPIVSGFGSPISAVSAFGSIWINTSSYSISGMSDPASVLRWDGTTWSTFGGIASLFPQSTSVNAYGNDIILTGLFGVVGTQVPPPGQGSSGQGGVTSVGWARLNTAGGLPTISSSPSNVTTCTGGGGNFTVVGASNNPPLGYQWQWREVGAPSYQQVLAGANARFAAANVDKATVSISGVTKGTSLEFRALVFDACSGPGNGPLSDPGALTLCSADLNCDGIVEDSDFTIFVTAYNLLDCADPAMPAGCPSDLNADGIVEDSDFILFVGAYNLLVCE
jgi:hypothetical protein